MREMFIFGYLICKKINQLKLLDGVPEKQRDMVEYIILNQCHNGDKKRYKGVGDR